VSADEWPRDDPGGEGERISHALIWKPKEAFVATTYKLRSFFLSSWRRWPREKADRCKRRSEFFGAEELAGSLPGPSGDETALKQAQEPRDDGDIEEESVLLFLLLEIGGEIKKKGQA
jgi:hypothetical protein